MESAHDSIKYIKPVYTNAQRDSFDWDLNQPKYDMDNRFDDVAHNHDVMYESVESRYATELVNVADENIDADAGMATGVLTVTFDGGALAGAYIPTSSVLYFVVDGDRKACAMQDEKGQWFGGKDILVFDDIYLKVASAAMVGKNKSEFKLEGKNGEMADYAPLTGAAGAEAGTYDVFAGDVKLFTIKKNGAKYNVVGTNHVINFAAIGRFDSERDLTGKYLGEVELVMKDYHFRPRVISMGITWTHLAEVTLDTSFGVSAEEMLMDSASGEIKKTLDFQAVKLGFDGQRTMAPENFVQFNAEAGGDTKDSYYHTAQLIGQAIDRIGDVMYNKINRGGVTAIVGGPAAVNYLKLNKAWSDKGKMVMIGGHKVGELDGVPVFKVPSSIIPDNQLLTTWKNPTAEGDVSIAIGTLIPFYSTGILPRKNFYKEAGVARYEDSQILNANYLGRIQINNIRELNV